MVVAARVPVQALLALVLLLPLPPGPALRLALLGDPVARLRLLVPAAETEEAAVPAVAAEERAPGIATAAAGPVPHLITVPKPLWR